MEVKGRQSTSGIAFLRTHVRLYMNAVMNGLALSRPHIAFSQRKSWKKK